MRPLPTADLDHVLARTRVDWERMRGASVFITGGTGFFGAWLVESFLHANRRLDLGARATILSRDPAGFRGRFPHLAADPALDLLAGDIRLAELPSGRFDFAIHAATETRPNFASIPPGEMLLANLRGTEKFLELVRRAGVRRFLFTSSGAVYGPQPAAVDRIGETTLLAPDPLEPSAAYGESKRASELLCAAASRPGHSEGMIARCFVFVGPHLALDANYAIGNFIRDAMAGKPLAIAGDGTPLRSYLYAADLAVWLWTILFRGSPGQAYNVGSSDAISIRQVAEAVRDVVNPALPIAIAGTPRSGVIPGRYVPDNLKARTALGLEVALGLPESIRRTVAWHRGS